MIGILFWWVLVELAGIAVLPFTLFLFKKLPDSGYPFSRIMGLIILSYILWMTGTLGLFPYTEYTIWLMLALLTVICWFSSGKSRQSTIDFILQQHSLIMFYEIAGIFCFLIWLAIRSFTPEIIGAEKFMDLGILNALIRTEKLPPPDPWFSGHSIKYYYFGHFIYATLSKISLSPAHYTYNYALATIFFLTAISCISLGYNLGSFDSYKQGSPINKIGIKTGLLTFLFVSVLGNLDGLLQFLQKKSLFMIEYWQSSRIIPNTINEFPFFSFLHGDLHAHVLNIPIFLLFLISGLTILSNKKFSVYYFIWIGFLLGTISVTNPWDALPLSAFFILILIFRYPFLFSVYFPIILSAGFIFYLPFYFQLPVSFHGLGWVTTPTQFHYWLIITALPFYIFATIIYRRIKPVNDPSRLYFYTTGIVFLSFLIGIVSKNILLGILSAFIFFISVELYTGFQHFKHIETYHSNSSQSSLISSRYSQSKNFCFILWLTAFLCWWGCELIYIKDPLGGIFYRLNTVFKNYLAAWILSSIGSAYIGYYLLQKMNKFWVGGFFALLVSCSFYPLGSLYTHSYGFQRKPTLNGWNYLEKYHPDDFRGIEWIQENISGTPVILEYIGDTYTYAGRVSSNTGLPTLLGWVNHEYAFRNNLVEIQNRLQNCNTLWFSADLFLTRDLLKKYRIKYVFIGELERQNITDEYLSKWNQLGEIVFSTNNVIIYKINPIRE